jgi:hypothetical protein
MIYLLLVLLFWPVLVLGPVTVYTGCTACCGGTPIYPDGPSCFPCACCITQTGYVPSILHATVTQSGLSTYSLVLPGTITFQWDPANTRWVSPPGAMTPTPPLGYAFNTPLYWDCSKGTDGMGNAFEALVFLQLQCAGLSPEIWTAGGGGLDNPIVNGFVQSAATTSSTTNTIAASVNKTFTVATGLQIVTGQAISVTNVAGTEGWSRTLLGDAHVVSYNSGTGALVINGGLVVGSGHSYSSWIITADSLLCTGSPP